jgi:hypothetical protein
LAAVEPICRPWTFPAAAVGDLADLLDIHVDQLAWVVAFVAHRGDLRGSDHLAGQRVALPQVRHPVAAQNPRDRPGRHAELGTDPVLAPTFLAPHHHDRFFDLDRSL